MWRHLNLRTRILLGYGVILMLACSLALLLVLRINKLNDEIGQINASVAAATDASVRLAARVSDTQQTVDRYLQQPLVVERETVTASLAGLTSEVEELRQKLTNPAQRERLDHLGTTLATYWSTLDEMGVLLEEQRVLRTGLTQFVFVSNITLAGTVDTYLRNRSISPVAIDELNTAQSHLLLAFIWINRLSQNDIDLPSRNALRELDEVRDVLELHLTREDSGEDVQVVFRSVTQAISTTQKLSDNLALIQSTHEQALTPQANLLKEEADALARDGLAELTSATTELEQETQAIQQVAGIALLGTLLLAIAIGARLAQTISRPIVTLVGVTERINRGDYSSVVPSSDGSEIGQLATAFNRMMLTLNQQRAEVQRQQEALGQRNTALEETLGRLQTETEAREALTTTVRNLSVPVIPILSGVLVVPLVGEIDQERAEFLQQRLLQGVSERQARIVIIDITGVPYVDLSLARWLAKAASAVMLLGAQCILVGISPEVAQALVASNADLSMLTTRADLRDGVEYAMRQVNGHSAARSRAID